MQMKSSTLPLLTIFFLLSGCVTTGGTAEVAELNILVAEYRLDKAEQSAHLWLNSTDILEQARAAYAKGDFITATLRAREARFQGEQALEQAKTASGAVPWQFK